MIARPTDRVEGTSQVTYPADKLACIINSFANLHITLLPSVALSSVKGNFTSQPPVSGPDEGMAVEIVGTLKKVTDKEDSTESDSATMNDSWTDASKNRLEGVTQVTL